MRAVLIVDSYQGSRRALGDLLREHGYPVFEAVNGMEGLRIAREIRPALIVVDLWPFFSAGVQMLEHLRESLPTDRAEVLVLTSVVSVQHRDRAVAAGCAGFLEKPCGADHVLAEVRRIMGGSLPNEPGPPRRRRRGAAPLALARAASIHSGTDSQYQGGLRGR